MPRCVAVIPAYNEEATIERVVRLTRQYADVCVVDDASTDQTPQILGRLQGIYCIRHRKNTHIPGAILDGMRFAWDAGYDYCITLDAGMSHDPVAIGQFQQHTDADLVIGYRGTKVNVPLYRRALSWGGNILINLVLDPGKVILGRVWLRDVTSGYRMYSRNAFGLLLQSEIKSRSFDFHLEALVCIYRKGMRIKEIPIVYVHSNSSLRWKVVGHALQTCWRLWRSDN